LAEALRSRTADRSSLADHAVVCERNLGVEAVDQDAIVLLYNAVRNADVAECEAGKFRNITSVLGVQTCTHGIDDADGTSTVRLVLEHLLLSGAHAAVLELLINDLQPLFDFRFGCGGAIAAEQELDDIGRNGICSGIAADQVFADDEAFKGACAHMIPKVILDLQHEWHARLRRFHADQ
jgi:hypothetical protein